MTSAGAITRTVAPDPIPLLGWMWLIRAFEEKVAEVYAARFDDGA